MVTLNIFLILLALALAGSVAGQPTVQNLGVVSVSHSQVQISFTVSESYNNLRLRSVPTADGGCKGGTGGLVIGAPANSGGFSRVTVTGLEADTEYEICPEVDNGSFWSTGVGIIARTLTHPSPSPALPIPPKTFDSSYPDTSTYQQVTVAADCSDLNAKISQAITVQGTTGTVINIPAGTICSQQIAPSEYPSDRIVFSSTNVDVSSSTITMNNHGFTEGYGIIFGWTYGSGLPSPSEPRCWADGSNDIRSGVLYYVSVVDSNTIQIYCGATKDKGGALMTFGNTGFGNQMFAYPFPRKLKEIIIRTATPDEQFVPEGVRVSPEWKPKMASLVRDSIKGEKYENQNAPTFIYMGNIDGNEHNCLANIRFTGIEITTTNDSSFWTSTDPPHWERFFQLFTCNSGIVFDRCYIHGLGTPHRMLIGLGWDGMNLAIVDSYFEGLEYWHSKYTGLGATMVSDNSFTIDAGQHNVGSAHPRLEQKTTVLFSGTGSGRALVYFDLNNAFAFTVAYPEGITSSSCDGVTCSFATSTAGPGGCDWTMNWLARDQNGLLAAAQIACIDIEGGKIVGISNADPRSQWSGVGSQFMIGGYGPGPYMFVNNYVQEVGNPWHHDDSGGFTWDRRFISVF